MKDVIIEEKVKEKERLSESIINTTVPIEVTQASSFINLAEKYI